MAIKQPGTNYQVVVAPDGTLIYTQFGSLDSQDTVYAGDETIESQQGADYQIVTLPDGSLLLTQMDSFISGNTLEWDDTYAEAAPTGAGGKLLGMATAKIQGIAVTNIL